VEAANVDVRVLSSLRVQLGRFAQLAQPDDVDDRRDLSLYEPQGVEHSFCLKVSCQLDKVGSSQAQLGVRRTPFEDVGNDPAFDRARAFAAARAAVGVVDESSDAESSDVE